jgi:hypothetical protein
MTTIEITRLARDELLELIRPASFRLTLATGSRARCSRRKSSRAPVSSSPALAMIASTEMVLGQALGCCGSNASETMRGPTLLARSMAG